MEVRIGHARHRSELGLYWNQDRQKQNVLFRSLWNQSLLVKNWEQNTLGLGSFSWIERSEREVDLIDFRSIFRSFPSFSCFELSCCEPSWSKLMISILIHSKESNMGSSTNLFFLLGNRRFILERKAWFLSMFFSPPLASGGISVLRTDWFFQTKKKKGEIELVVMNTASNKTLFTLDHAWIRTVLRCPKPFHKK